MPRKRKTLTVGDWRDLVAVVPPELVASSLPLRHSYTVLRGKLAEVERLVVERDAHEAQKQEATKKIAEILESGARTATLVRDMLREHYGPESEQLVAFKIKPFRGRKRARKGNESEPSQPSAKPKK